MSSELHRVFRAFADENRIRVLELLCEGEQCACVLLEDMSISQPTLSHHMKILCKSGIVKSRRIGKWNYYSIDKEGCKYGIDLLNMLIDHKMDEALRVARLIDGLLHPVRAMRKIRIAVRRIESSESTCCC